MFDNQISSNDLKKIDKNILELKERVLSDFAIHFLGGKKKYSELKLEVFKKKVIRNPKKLIIKIDKPNNIDEDNRCMAKIYDNGYNQCKKKRNDFSEYCFVHIKKLNYGRIDDSE